MCSHNNVFQLSILTDWHITCSENGTTMKAYMYIYIEKILLLYVNGKRRVKASVRLTCIGDF